MPIDTSSYYPEVPSPDGGNDGYSLNRREGGLFGSSQNNPEPPEREPLPRHDAPERESEKKNRSKDDPESSGERFITVCSNLLSWILVPLLMPVYGVMLAFGLSILDFTPIGVKLTYALIVLSINVLLPAVAILLLKKAGLVHDVGLNERKERSLPYLMCIICLVATGIFMQTKGAPHWLAMFYYAGAATGLVELVINQWWKISVHCAGAAGIVALLLHIQYDDFCLPATYTWIIVSIALAGLLGAARIWLGRHTLGQVLAGYAVGFCGVFFLMGL